MSTNCARPTRACNPFSPARPRSAKTPRFPTRPRVAQAQEINRSPSPSSLAAAALPLHFLLIELDHIGNLFLGQALLYPLVSLIAKQLFGHFGRQLAHYWQELGVETLGDLVKALTVD